MLEMFIAALEESLGLLVRPPIAPIARMGVIVDEIDRLKRDAAEHRHAPVTGQATVSEDFRKPEDSGAGVRCPGCGELLIEQHVHCDVCGRFLPR